MKKKTILATLVVAMLTISPAMATKIKPMKEFVDELMAKMTLQEKIGQLNLMVAGDITTGGALNTQVGGDIAAGNMGGVFNIKASTRSSIARHRHQEEPTGHTIARGYGRDSCYETMFPIPLALSCSWDTEAMKLVGAVSAKEATADGINWTFSPMVDVALDARWGRISEGNGEDPYLSGILGAAMTQGYQAKPPPRCGQRHWIHRREQQDDGLPQALRTIWSRGERQGI